MRPDYQVQQVFEFNRNCLLHIVDLHLSLAEQIRLRNITEQVVFQVNNMDMYSRNSFDPRKESLLRFLNQEYGLSFSDESIYEPILGVRKGAKARRASGILNFVQGQQNKL